MMTIFQPFANTLWNTVKDTEITKVPKTDLRDTGDSYLLEADMPGFKKEEIKLSLEGDVLTIAAEQKMRPIVKVLLNRLTRLRKAHTCSGSAVSVSICSAWISATWMQTALMRHMKTAC